MNMKPSVLQALNTFRSTIAKTASVTDGVPDGTTTPKAGERSKENSSDIKATTPANVESAPVAGTGNNNTSATNTGDPTGVNVPTAKTTKEDPGTTHPAKAGPMSGGATKSASVTSLANELLADIAMATKVAAETPAVPATPAAPAPVAQAQPEATKTAAETKPVAESDEALGFATGSKLAADLVGDTELTKLASDYLVERLHTGTPDAEQLARNIIQLAVTDAYNVANYIKQAGDLDGGAVLPPPGAAAGGPPVPPPDAAGPPAPAGGGAGAVDPQAVELGQALISGQITLDDLMQVISGGGGEGGAPAAPEADKKGPATAETAATEHKEADKTASLAKQLVQALRGSKK